MHFKTLSQLYGFTLHVTCLLWEVTHCYTLQLEQNMIVHVIWGSLGIFAWRNFSPLYMCNHLLSESLCHELFALYYCLHMCNIIIMATFTVYFCNAKVYVAYWNFCPVKNDKFQLCSTVFLTCRVVLLAHRTLQCSLWPGASLQTADSAKVAGGYED